ncbi:sugar ABC transporter ATP-binding protein [Aliidiomarina soli]|uniref:Sugar ABC transporter ATP-binding protein n=1 Tax=Aliidiomarina soli TaxID=1928574 RepID=A0A432WFB3_9GAMM|nr:sugar ABC transporter ATP-binding protein [Aliidiomarina soli]RUO32441.1 sugar ABC transporter ATP-binding protein [Aliidiomarina soli]
MQDQQQEQHALFELSNISKAFPGVKALDTVDFRLFPGEVHALLGENGAGKSTLVKIMTGVLAKDSGCIQLQQQEIHPSNTAEAQQLGIAPVYQEVNLLPNLSVAHNLFLGREPTRFGCIRWQQMAEDARQLLTRFKLDIDVTESLSQYSVAVQQLIAIARGVAMNAKVLVLDEPTASLDSSEVEILFDILRQLKSEGIGMLFITHFLEQVYQISDRITVLRSGKLIGEYLTTDLPRSRLIEAMLGQELQQVTAQPVRTDAAQAEALLTVTEASVAHSVDKVSLTVNKGEAVGMAGLLGSGRTEVCRALFGIDTLKSGEIKMREQVITLNQSADAMQQGIALCPEDRKTDGIIGPLSIRENIALALQVQAGWWRYIAPDQQRTLANQYIESFNIATPNAEKPIEELSGGNQQKVILARWLATRPQLLILDEPTRGIDIGAHAEIIKLIKSLCDEGMSLLVASSELEELVAFANRVVVMRDHRKVAELQGAELTAQSIMHSIAEV